VHRRLDGLAYRSAAEPASPTGKSDHVVASCAVENLLRLQLRVECFDVFIPRCRHTSAIADLAQEYSRAGSKRRSAIEQEALCKRLRAVQLRVCLPPQHSYIVNQGSFVARGGTPGQLNEAHQRFPILGRRGRSGGNAKIRHHCGAGVARGYGLRDKCWADVSQDLTPAAGAHEERKQEPECPHIVREAALS
jgi:hypothetical protein